MSGTSFTSNSANRGGAIFLDGLFSTTTWYSITANYNTAIWGGFLFQTSTTSYYQPYLEISYSYIHSNQALVGGGAFALYGHASIQSSTVMSNGAGIGGAAYVNGTSVWSSGG